jgi:hypothetical protein
LGEPASAAEIADATADDADAGAAEDEVPDEDDVGSRDEETEPSAVGERS